MAEDFDFHDVMGSIRGTLRGRISARLKELEDEREQLLGLLREMS